MNASKYISFVVLFGHFFVLIKCDWVEITQVTSPSTKQTEHSKQMLTYKPEKLSTPTSIFLTYLEQPDASIITSEGYNKTLNGIAEKKKKPLRGFMSKNLESSLQTSTWKIEELDEYNDYIHLKEKDQMKQNILEDTEGGHSYKGFVPLIETVQSTLMRNSNKNFKGKLEVLADLRDTLIYSLKEKMCTFWGESTNRRVARDYKHDDGHIEFPSNEGALMTIGFLTFAVFLIKCVLQLLNTFRNNNNTTTAALIGRRKRSTDLNEEGIHILRLLDDFKFK